VTSLIHRCRLITFFNKKKKKNQKDLWQESKIKISSAGIDPTTLCIKKALATTELNDNIGADLHKLIYII